MGRWEPGDHPEAQVDEEGAANGEAADEVVERIAGEDEVAQWLVLRCRAVAVVPVEELLG